MTKTKCAIFFFFFCCLSSAVFAGSTDNHPIVSAKKYFKDGSFSKAIDVLEAHQKKYPQDPETQYWLGVCYLNSDKVSAAQTSFFTASKADRKYEKSIGKAYLRVGFRELRNGHIRKSRILFQKAVRYDPTLKRVIGQKSFAEGERLFNNGQYEEADERFSVANTFDIGYSDQICNLYFRLGNSLDNKNCIYFYSVANWYCSGHNEEMGLRMLRIAKSKTTKERREKYKAEAAKYLGEEAVRSVFPTPSWKTVHSSLYMGKGYDEINSPEYHIRTVQFGKEVTPGDKVIVKTEGTFRIWDAGWQDRDSHCTLLPQLKTAGEYLYLEGREGERMTVKVQRYE